jgi:signal transduction histidine kinase
VAVAKRRRTIARRIAGAFALVLVLFAFALVVMIVALDQIGAAEDEVARLDRSKHAGHHAAAMAREQYMHQAHTLLTWDGSHLHHYGETAAAAKKATEHLRHALEGHGEMRQADEIASLIAESDRRFREEVWPAIQRGEIDRRSELHELTEAPVARVVALNNELNASLERASDRARNEADDIRARAKLAVIACFALAIAAAAAVGFFLLRSISRPVAALRAGVTRISAGDLTTRVALPGNDELADLARVFDQMAADLVRHQDELLKAHRLASIGQVASGVAHELNNPLGVILGYLRLLRRESDREELRIIEDEVHQSQMIVQGLLDLARPLQLDSSEIDLGQLARETADRLEESGAMEGVEIRYRDAAPISVVADESKVRQIATNLLTNAIEAARDPKAAAPVVEIAWCARDGRAWLQIDDQGPGIPSETMARVFEPFFTTRANGHGLGLAIARTLAHAHGGDVTLEARPGGAGTRALLALPIQGPSSSRSLSMQGASS